MTRRCNSPKHPGYSNYGGRGIRVCPEWSQFLNFLAAMGKRPKNTTLGRINNDGNYEPGNCRWETDTQQHRNRRDNRWITHAGETLTMAEWAERIGIAQCTLGSRLGRRWPVHLAVTVPPKPGRRIIRESFEIRRASALKMWARRRGVA